MKKLAVAAALSLALAGGAQAQTLQPQMSAQDVQAGIEIEESHILVPILMMIFLVLTAAGGGGAGQYTGM